MGRLIKKANDEVVKKYKEAFRKIREGNLISDEEMMMVLTMYKNLRLIDKQRILYWHLLPYLSKFDISEDIKKEMINIIPNIMDELEKIKEGI